MTSRQLSHFLVFFASCLGLGAFDLTKLDLSYQYDISEPIRFKHRIVKTSTGLSVFYEITGDTSQSLTLDVLTQSGYASVTHDTLKIFKIDTLLRGGKSLYRIDFQPLAKRDLLIFSVGLPALKTYWLFDVEIGSQVGYPDFYPVDSRGLPILVPYVTNQECRLEGVDSIFHVYQYTEDFGPADPPMGQMKALSPTLRVDSAYFTSANFKMPSRASFYLIQKDSTAQNGITMLSVPTYFPEQKRLEELVDPITYIATDNEMSALRGGTNLKEVFEKFWINTYGTRLRAKSAIRLYYDGVEAANLLFTDYKPGWQTDRGMIYMIFGKPEQVTRTDNAEIWRYDTTQFEFIRIPSLFTPSLYTLKRDIKHDKTWYLRVGTIRKG